MNQKLLTLIAATIIFSIGLNAIEIKSISQAVDVAGKQRMFTQRMLKDYALIGMENIYSKPNEDLKKIMNDFENHLQSLLNFAPNDDIKKSIANTNSLWTPIKKTLSSKPNIDEAGNLQKQLELLLKSSDDTTKLYAKASGKTSGEIINISGRQRMLSQRMASLYMFKAWGVKDLEFKNKLDNATKLFETSLAKLQESDLNTDEISSILKYVKKSFMFFRIMNKSKSRFAPTLINKKSNIILKKMNTATGLYVAAEEDKK